MKKQRKLPRSWSVQELITRYYDDLEKEDPALPAMLQDGGEFDKEKLYRNLLVKTGKRTRTLQVIRKSLRIAASIAILCSLLLAYQYRNIISNYLSPAQITEKSTVNGEIAELVLSDGTRVWLNSGSKISYPAKFRGSTREINLVGEAYLEVAHQAGKAFLIHTDEITVKVLGTRFNISAYEEDKNITVAVVEGKVSVSDQAAGIGKGSHTIYITPNQRAVYSRKTRTLSHEEKINTVSAVSWKEGKLTYQRTPLPEILADLQRKYGVSIHAGEQVEDCLISANFNNDPLKKVLTILAELVNGEIMNQGTVYFIQGSGCRRE